MKPISIQLYTVRELISEIGLPAVLEQIAAIGYKGVEGGGDSAFTNEQFRKMVEDLGMVVSSTWGDIASDEGIGKLIESCQTLGTTYAAGGFWIPAFETRHAIAETAAVLNRALPTLEDAGIKFGLHNHWMEFERRDNMLVMDILVQEVPDLQLELDIYWSSNFGENRPEEMVARYAERVVLLHVKDGPQVEKQPMTAVGHGTVNVPACVLAADPAWLVVELDEFDGNMMDAVRDSYAYLTAQGLASGNR